MSYQARNAKKWGVLTHRPIELSFLIHAEVQSGVHAPDADQTDCQTDELQDTLGSNMQAGQEAFYCIRPEREACALGP